MARSYTVKPAQVVKTGDLAAANAARIAAQAAAIAAAADAIATAADAVATAADRVQTGEDATQTGNDAAQTAADRAAVEALVALKLGAFVSTTAPTTGLILGQLWYNSETGVFYVYYDNFWVSITPSPIEFADTPTAVAGASTSTVVSPATVKQVRAAHGLTSYLDAGGFQAAATAGGVHVVPSGDYTPGTITAGADPVFWFAGETTQGGGAVPLVSVPGIVEQWFERRKLLRQNTTADNDTATLQIQRFVSHSGGSPSLQNAGLRVDSHVPAGVTNLEWAIVGTVYNASTGGEQTGVYGRGVREVAGSNTWGGTFEFNDATGLADPTGSCVGVELDVWANGTDASNSRVVADAVVGRPAGSSGAQCEAGFGFRVTAKNLSALEGRVKRAFAVQGIEFDSGFDTSLGTQASGGAAFRMAEGQRFALTADGAKYIEFNSNYLKFWENGNERWRVGDASQSGVMNNNGEIHINYSQVLTSRRTGWGAPTGTATRSTFATGSVTLPDLAARVKALIDDLTTHGLIGA